MNKSEIAEKKLELFKGSESENQSIKQKIKDTHTAELIIGLCGPIGTDIHFIADCFNEVLDEVYNYRYEKIKLSDLIREYSPDLKIDEYKESKFEIYKKLIDAGNKLRETYGNSILAELAINEIAVKREQMKKGENFESSRTCYIIDSIKNKEELEIFRLIYGELFNFVGVFTSLDKRIHNLKNKKMREDEIFKLINRDSGEEMIYGQKVTDTFIEADFFLRVTTNSKTAISNKIKRYLDLIFSSDVITPTKHENAMYLAYAAAGNSACLSRQIGAAITDSNNEVLALGWNDVPKCGGGVYQYDENDPLGNNDKRCMFQGEGKCFNDIEKKNICEELISDLIKKGLIQNDKKEEAYNIIKNSRIKELGEFSRAVHAEMLALLLGSQKTGDRIINGKLYTTTYPCHNCARHIVTAGIKEIYYIEPYRKSLATKLHDDSLTEDESNINLVRILMFDGVSPKRFLNYFKMDPYSRKREGIKINKTRRDINPKKTISLQAIPILEKIITNELKEKKLIIM